MSDVVLAIDIGSEKVCAIIAEVSDGKIDILAHGISKSDGIKKGMISNIELASKSIKEAVSDAKIIAGKNISSAVISISHAYTKSLISTGVVNIPHKEISISEITRVMQAARHNANVPSDYAVVHVIPYNFRIDGQNDIDDPFGMNANRMEVDANIIITQKSNLSNLSKAVKLSGLDIDSVVLNGYASAISTIDNDEKVGVALIDMGDQTSSLVVQIGNSIRYNSFLPVGSGHISNDLSIALHTPPKIAEKIKIEYGILKVGSEKSITIPKIGDETKHKSISVESIHQVMNARVEETLFLLSKSLEKSDLQDKISSGLILTGGMSKLKGIRELAEVIFPKMSVRIGYPKKVNGFFDELNDPIFSVSIGLLLYKAGHHTEYEIDFRETLLHSKEKHLSESDNENLSNIKIESTVEEVNQRIHEDNSNEVIAKSGIVFDDLPNLSQDNYSILKKIRNWVKQLF